MNYRQTARGALQDLLDSKFPAKKGAAVLMDRLPWHDLLNSEDENLAYFFDTMDRGRRTIKKMDKRREHAQKNLHVQNYVIASLKCLGPGQCKSVDELDTEADEHGIPQDELIHAISYLLYTDQIEFWSEGYRRKSCVTQETY